ncbi:hypothetical protein JS533_001040 [Bifidobacterium amazonense]|uniref:Riboflavin deaminase n=1 Tax=Bifidobacterium amazonense TaxID=2809027 RepID=A0ABS9VS13_9BIFI|nr:hypothetical protein [Bifidobacterium amazonense]MCH9274874.1 hypothetical protein [Bifidobacterium amazonense]
MGDSHTMDVVGFLTAAQRLGERFDTLMSRVTGRGRAADASNANNDNDDSNAVAATGGDVGKPDRPVLEPQGPPDGRLMSAASGRLVGATVDKRMFILSGGLYGGSSWATMFCIATATGEESLANECRIFLHDSIATVNELGLNAWICNLVDDARQAAFTGVPSSNMPLLIRSMRGEKLVRQSLTVGSSRYGDRKLRGEAILEHCEQTHRLAAYSLLQWGCDERDNDVASMLLARPNIGTALLRERRTFARGGKSQDSAARRIVSYLSDLQAQADRQYAWMRGRHRAFGLLSDDADALARRSSSARDDPGTLLLEADRRYLFDARHVVTAYRDMWDLPASEACAEPLMEIGRGGEPPCESLWRNQIHLRRTAEALLGSVSSADLTDGFAARNRERFEYGVSRLEQVAAIVRDAGLATAPRTIAPSVCPNFGELKLLSSGARDRRLREHARVESDMAAVMLAYLPDSGIARRAGAALIRGDLTAYGTIVDIWRDDLRARSHDAAFA